MVARYRAHDLSGGWVGYRDCHIKPELLLTDLPKVEFRHSLTPLGSHSEIFE
ncbi:MULTISPECIES: type II toxin-antitoxin system mRNA interferase toxin, RelE/StbE family [Mycetohabitans]|uniref:type II toxin-antitoxin system mRNA interferase toxin, RelE/StbE family n=1 Tax=Mycetohabitans TaxID=2571159 RepID=UPI001F376683